MLGKDIQEWEMLHGVYTASEIAQEPATWRKTLAQFREIREDLWAFIQQITGQPDFDIILTGAGTSEYVGNAAQPGLSRYWDFRLRSVASTDICAAPRKYLSPERPTLLVSFARSGNSPESLGAVQAVDALCAQRRHLFITCNREGALAKAARERDDCYCVLLTPETDDKSFAMTSSFTNMYLAALLSFRPDAFEPLCEEVELAAQAGERCLDSWRFFRDIAMNLDYDRLVYLGSGELKGLAQESALKTLELTAGRVATFSDSPMGFRHGPKSIINDRTLLVLYLSDEEDTRRYEMDLLRELNRQKKGNRILTISNEPDPEVEAMGNLAYRFHFGRKMSSSAAALGYILAAQQLALFKSQKLGIHTDDPCPTGEVNRVVTGVTIYPVKGG